MTSLSLQDRVGIDLEGFMASGKAKYEVIKEYLYQSIISKVFLPHRRIPSEHELCRLFDVSRIVVRRAVDEMVLTGYLYRIQGKGTFVAEQSTRKNGKVSACIAGMVLNYLNSFSKNILSAVESRLARENILTMVAQTFDDQKNEESILQRMHEEGARGFIVYTTSVPSAEKKISTYVNLQSPVIFIDRFIKEWPFDAVLGEDWRAGYQAVEHLYSHHGVQRIGLLGLEPSVVSSVQERVRGTKEALGDLALPCKDEWFEPSLVPRDQENDDYPREIRSQVRRYLSENDSLEGLVVINDPVAAAVYQACDEMGVRIPQDLKVVSFTNTEYARFLRPPLTSFDQNVQIMGRRAAQLLLERMRKIRKERPVQERLPFSLVVRGSCGCPHHEGANWSDTVNMLNGKGVVG